MQLTKEDVIFQITQKGKREVIELSKLKEVVAFYDKYRDKLYRDFPEELKGNYEQYVGSFYPLNSDYGKFYLTECIVDRNWLFNYCFVEGLK